MEVVTDYNKYGYVLTIPHIFYTQIFTGTLGAVVEH